MSDFTDQLATDAADVFCNVDEYAEAVTVNRITGADISCNAVKQQLVGAADKRDETNFFFDKADYPAPAEGDYVTTDADSRRYVVTKTTDRNEMWEVQAFAPVEAN